MEKIGLISGTGVEGRGIALRLGLAGLEVKVGSRSAERARQTASTLNARLGQKCLSGTDNHQLMDECELLFLTVPFQHAAKVLDQYQEQFASRHVLVDVTVPLLFQDGPQLVDLEEPSGAEHLRQRLPAHVPMVATFKTLPAPLLSEMDSPLDCDELICGDTPEAKRRVLAVVEKIEGIRWLDAGPLRLSRSLEAMTVLVLEMNRRYKVKHGRFKMVGL